MRFERRLLARGKPHEELCSMQALQCYSGDSRSLSECEEDQGLKVFFQVEMVTFLAGLCILALYARRFFYGDYDERSRNQLKYSEKVERSRRSDSLVKKASCKCS